jgi:hypothetical protein
MHWMHERTQGFKRTRSINLCIFSALESMTHVMHPPLFYGKVNDGTGCLIIGVIIICVVGVTKHVDTVYTKVEG